MMIQLHVAISIHYVILVRGVQAGRRYQVMVICTMYVRMRHKLTYNTFECMHEHQLYNYDMLHDHNIQNTIYVAK